MLSCKPPWLALFTLPAVHTPAWPQQVIRSYLEPWENSVFVTGPVDSLGDIDSDGASDIIFGDPKLTINTMPNAGRVRVLSGTVGSVMRSHEGMLPELRLGFVVKGLADVSGDGVPDYLGTPLDQGEAFLWSGADGATLAQLERFLAMDSLGDTDGDGIPDLVLTLSNFLAPGRATVYQGGAFLPRYSIVSPPESVHFGASVTGLGDVDGDGLDDFAVGAPGGGLDIVCVPGEVYVFSGVDGHLLYRLEGEGLNSLFGVRMASPGDLSGDGFRDLAVAASFCCCDVGCFFGCKRRPGRIYFFDGRTGERLGTFELASEAGDGLGKDMIAARDLDGNGYADVLATFNDSPGTTLVAIDGGTREEIYSMLDPYRSSCTYGGFGLEIAAAGDTNADDFPDFLASSACLTGSPWNRIDLVSGAPVGLRALGEPCGDESPRIGATGVPRAGRLYALHVSRVGPGETALLLMDFPGSASPPPPARRSGSDCARLFPRLSYSTVTRAVRPGEGAATVEIKLPGSAAWIGVRLHAQWLVRGASGWSATRVLEIEIQPPARNRGG